MFGSANLAVINQVILRTSGLLVVTRVLLPAACYLYILWPRATYTHTLVAYVALTAATT